MTRSRLVLDTEKCAQCGADIVRSGWVSAKQASYYTMADGFVALCSPKCDHRWVESQAALRAAAADVDKLGEPSRG